MFSVVGQKKNYTDEQTNITLSCNKLILVLVALDKQSWILLIKYYYY